MFHVFPEIGESFYMMLGDIVKGERTKPCCQHGNPFCDDDWLPLHPECGCLPSMAQISVMTHYALTPEDKTQS